MIVEKIRGVQGLRRAGKITLRDPSKDQAWGSS
jgi:hypothetical protein